MVDAVTHLGAFWDTDRRSGEEPGAAKVPVALGVYKPHHTQRMVPILSHC